VTSTSFPPVSSADTPLPSLSPAIPSPPSASPATASTTPSPASPASTTPSPAAPLASGSLAVPPSATPAAPASYQPMALPVALAALGTSAPVPTQLRPQPAQPVPAPAPPAAQPAVAAPSFDGGSAAVDQKPQMADPLADVSIPPQPVVVFSDDVEELLDEGCVLYPVVADKRGQAVLPYSFAKSEDAFRAWNLGKRKSTEVRPCSFTSCDLQACADSVSPAFGTNSGSAQGRSESTCGARFSSTFLPRRWCCGVANTTRSHRYVRWPPPSV
jgi:hypothetical protein